MTMASSTMLLSGILWAGCVAVAVAEQPPTARDDAPAFRSLPLPARYRQKPTDREMFTIGQCGNLAPGGRWYVTGLLRHDKTAKLYGVEVFGGAIPLKDQGISSVGLLAIEIKTGAARVLLWSDPADAGCGCCTVDQESCYAWLDRSGEPASKENQTWGQRWGLDCAVYQWDFRTGRIEKRGYNWLIAQFAAAAGPAVAQRIVWPQRFDPNWDGTVRLRGRKPGETIQFPLLDVEAARRDPFGSGYWWHRPRFLPGSRDDEVMVLYWYADGPAGTWLSMISLDEAVKTRWSVTRKQLDPDGQWELAFSGMAAGISRNHRVVPLVARTCGRGEEEEREHLYAIRSKDGALLLEKRLSEFTVTTGVAASNDGSLVAWAWHEGDYPFEEIERRVCVLDASRDIILAQRVYTIVTADDDLGVCPVGFDPEKQLIMGHSESLWSLAPPYKGRFQPRFWLYPDARP